MEIYSNIGKYSDSFKSIRVGYGCGIRNPEGSRIMDMCTAPNLVVANSLFKRDINKLTTFSSGDTKTRTDYILTRHANLKHVARIRTPNNDY